MKKRPSYGREEAAPWAAVAIFNTRLAVMIGCVLSCVATVAFTCGPNSIQAVAVMLTDGAVVLGWVVAATVVGWIVLQKPGLSWTLRLEDRTGLVCNALHLATAAGLGIGVFSLLGLCLGLLGWLNRPVAIGFVAVPIVVAIAILFKAFAGRTLTTDPGVKDWLAQSAGLGWMWVVPAVSITVAAVSATVVPGILWKPFDPVAYDVLSYHLEVPREWYELGRIVPLHHNVFSYFPFNVEINDLLLMHLTGRAVGGDVLLSTAERGVHDFDRDGDLRDGR